MPTPPLLPLPGRAPLAARTGRLAASLLVTVVVACTLVPVRSGVAAATTSSIPSTPTTTSSTTTTTTTTTTTLPSTTTTTTTTTTLPSTTTTTTTPTSTVPSSMPSATATTSAAPMPSVTVTVDAAAMAWPVVSPADVRSAAELRRRIEDNGWRIATLGETYNGVVLRYEDARARTTRIRERARETRRRLRAAVAAVRSSAAGWYRRAAARSSGPSVPTVSLDGTRYTTYAAIASRLEIERLQALRRLRRQLTADTRAATKAVRDAEAARALLGATVERINAANALELVLLAEVEGRLGAGGAATGPADPRLVGADVAQVPVAPRVAAVILYARMQLGKPYVYATAGAATFDCSGLTMMAWRQAGVRMDHFSGAQYAAFPKVPLSQLQPGDLVFRGAGGREHVALYIGGGMQIAATHTGDYVRLQPLMSGISGAVRPG
jgi:cell wall-associated NlpC family hydrolase